MARPPVEWPIPQYVLELRERVVVTCRVPARLAAQVPLPLQPLCSGGKTVVSLCLGNGRVLKSVGGAERLASEFHTVELLTPAVWRPACRPALRGNYLLGGFADAPGVRRLLRTGAGLEAQAGRLAQGCGRSGYAWEGTLPVGQEGEAAAAARLPRPLAEISWPADSAFSSPEAAEAQLLHPEVVFFLDRDGRAVNGVPVHQYARAAVHAEAEWSGVEELLGGLLGACPEEVEVDHVFFQKRCTHTFFFPPERIPVAAPGAPRAGRVSAGPARHAATA